MREAVLMYAIRLPNGHWWRRGAGHSSGKLVPTLKSATQYLTKGSAKRAAQRLDLEETYGGYEIVECPRVIGDVVTRVGNAS